MEVWNRENTIRAKKEIADEYFTANIKAPKIADDPRNFHSCLQIFGRYKNKNGILNLNNGPIADT